MRYIRNIAESHCLGYPFAKLQKIFEYTNIMQKNYTFSSNFCCYNGLFLFILSILQQKNQGRKSKSLRKINTHMKLFSNKLTKKLRFFL